MADEIKLPPLPEPVMDMVRRGSISTGGRSFGHEISREGVYTKDQLQAYATQAIEAYKAQQGEAVPANCDVRKILLDIVPGDGDGYEVYAKSISDVETKLGNMGEELEDWQLGIKRYPEPAQQPMTDEQIDALMSKECLPKNMRYAFSAGIRSAECAHNIGAKP